MGCSVRKVSAESCSEVSSRPAPVGGGRDVLPLVHGVQLLTS